MALPREEQQRISRLYDEYGHVIFHRCKKLLRNSELARDATQDVFLKLSREVSRLEDDATLIRWIYRVATHHCLNLIRASVVKAAKEDTLTWSVVEGPTSELFPDRQLAAQVLSRFDAETQAVALGVLVDGMKYEEVAETLGVSSRTVSRKLDRFLVDARKYLQRSDI